MNLTSYLKNPIVLLVLAVIFVMYVWPKIKSAV